MELVGDYESFPLVFCPRAFERRVLLKVEVCYTSSHVHLHIFTSSHLRILTSSHLHTFSSSHLHICTSSHIFSLFSLALHLQIFISSYLHIQTSSYLHILISSLSLSLCLSLSLSLSCPLSRSLSFFFFSLLRPQAVPTRCHDMVTLLHETRFECQNLRIYCEIGWSW